MDGFWSSISKWFNEKTSSPLYFTYIGFFVAWNWELFQIIFLENENLFLSPRIEYIKSKLFFSASFPLAIPVWLHILVDWLLNTALHILPPALFTYLTILYLPRLHKWALNKYLESRFERKKIFEEKQREYDKWFLKQEKDRSRTLENIASLKEQQVETEKKIQKTMPEEEKWGIEYQEFEKSPIFFKFRQIIETIYKHRGYIESGAVRYAEAGVLAMADARELVSYVEGSRNTIELTKKGKFFAKMYLEKHPL